MKCQSFLILVLFILSIVLSGYAVTAVQVNWQDPQFVAYMQARGISMDQVTGVEKSVGPEYVDCIKHKYHKF